MQWIERRFLPNRYTNSLLLSLAQPEGFPETGWIQSDADLGVASRAAWPLASAHCLDQTRNPRTSRPSSLTSAAIAVLTPRRVRCTVDRQRFPTSSSCCPFVSWTQKYTNSNDAMQIIVYNKKTLALPIRLLRTGKV